MGKGQLMFKGEKKSSSKKSKKRKRDKTGDDTGDDVAVATNVKSEEIETRDTISKPLSSSSSTTTTTTTPSATNNAVTPSLKKGTGKITTSATVVTGYGTKFEKELGVGDAIMAVINGQEELRVITMRLSNTSLNVSSAFSTSIKHPQSFNYIPKPRNAEKERKLALKKQREQAQETEKSVYDLYSNQALVYREKTETGSYRIKRQELDGTQVKTRVDLLELRSKKTSDKYC
ncbi:hypothetical protein IV203_028539 [Nitzschia inconspicua]|uniref:Uncharacterized protein n=1 Tax=Nitzschia inconspicua TaxID=303405 RepID=A0A9K3LNR8_9STRA|nr:hypothetical protein IV203_028539 [Nitzschia inconspicua]